MMPEEIKVRVDEIDKQIIALLGEREQIESSTYITDFNGTTYVISKISPNIIIPDLQTIFQQFRQ